MSPYITIKYEALDIETIWKDNISYPISIAITHDEKINYYDIDVGEIETPKILNFLLKNCKSKRIYYVHNLTFEMFNFLPFLIKLNVKFKIISANKVIYSCKIWHNNKIINLRCSYRLTLLPLKELAILANQKEKGIFPYKILNEKMQNPTLLKKEDFNNEEEYNMFTKEFGTSINPYSCLKTYCENDALITKKSMIEYIKIIENYLNINMKNKRILTAAKLSITTFFISNKTIKKKIDIKIDRILRKYYFGGRTEVFGNPKEDEIILHFDWSGMYAQCLREKVLGGEIFLSEIVTRIEKPGFYWIKFRQNLDIPILPIKKEKLIFANGTFEGWYWYEEILLAIEYGIEILEINKTIGAQYYDNFIEDFVEKNDKIREKGGIFKTIGKNNNNTFYGRLGMNPLIEEEIISSEPETKGKFIEINKIFISYVKKEKNISNLTISACITAKARIKLYKGMMEVMKRGGRILYTDTDSIIAAFEKTDINYLLDKNMGEVKFNSKEPTTIIEDAVFAMPKTYALKFSWGEMVKIKGFNSKPSFEEFKKKFYNKEEIETINIQWKKKDFNITLSETKKRTNLNSLDKRIWNEDLKTTKPRLENVPLYNREDGEN